MLKLQFSRGQHSRGCVHLLPQPSCGNESLLQVDGDWLLAPRRISFKGHLAESPLKVEFVWDPPVQEITGPVGVLFKFNLKHWQGQALQGLAYFRQINELVTANAYDLVCFIRGNQILKRNYILPEGEARKQVTETMDFLTKCRSVAQKLGINPVFPDIELFRGKKLDDTRLLVKLLECGGHEQDNAGQDLGLSGEAPTRDLSSLPEPLTLQRSEPSKMMDSLGLQVPFGPLNHRWTDMHLISSNPLEGNKIEMMFKGGPHSIWRIETEPSTVGTVRK